jgi:TorA maturation chaperone TorD
MNAEVEGRWRWFSALFALLSDAFLEPEADVGRRAEALAADAAAGGGSSAGVCSALADWTQCHQSPAEQGTEYVRLFLHGSGNLPAHPYESVQIYGRLMAPECLAALGALYEEAQVRPRTGLAVPPDHLGLELEFLAHVLSNLAEAERGSAEARRWGELARRTVVEHLGPFSGRFVEKLEAASPAPFFHHAGTVLRLGLDACRRELAVHSRATPAAIGGP